MTFHVPASVPFFFVSFTYLEHSFLCIAYYTNSGGNTCKYILSYLFLLKPDIFTWVNLTSFMALISQCVKV